MKQGWVERKMKLRCSSATDMVLQIVPHQGPWGGAWPPYPPLDGDSPLEAIYLFSKEAAPFSQINFLRGNEWLSPEEQDLSHAPLRPQEYSKRKSLGGFTSFAKLLCKLVVLLQHLRVVIVLLPVHVLCLFVSLCNFSVMSTDLSGDRKIISLAVPNLLF